MCLHGMPGKEIKLKRQNHELALLSSLSHDNERTFLELSRRTPRLLFVYKYRKDLARAVFCPLPSVLVVRELLNQYSVLVPSWCPSLINGDYLWC